MNPDLEALHPYPFEKLAALKNGATPPAHLKHIALSIGEPAHASPAFVQDVLHNNFQHYRTYPTTKGIPELRSAIAQWASRRFCLPPGMLNAETQVLPVNGTREALFSFAQAVVNRSQQPLVLMPNPFYQIYEGAALLAGAEPYFMNCMHPNHFLPDLTAIPEQVWQRCQLLYICTPGNPTGAVMNTAYLAQLIELAHRYDFIIAGDECYSELYPDEAQPPQGLLQVCNDVGNNNFSHCVVFHSLSKRSNLPGLRSGFVAGDAEVLQKFLLYRTYHGSAMPVPTQYASIAAWSDEEHVQHNRTLYREKFARVLEVLQGKLDVHAPDAGFYLWAKTAGDDRNFARALFAAENITVLPGQFLSRDTHGSNPGAGYIRMALVASVDECVEAAQRMARFIDASSH